MLWIVYDVIAAITIALLMAVVVGLVCLPFQLAIQVGVPIWSASKLKKELLGESMPMPPDMAEPQ